MPRYSDELIDEIKANNDIVDVVSQYVQLKRKGRNFFGLCPFHNEKSGSFSVSSDKQIFHCFGCGIGGSVFNFIMQIEKVSFIESIEILAERAHIQLPITNNNDEKTDILKQKVYDLNLASAQFYHEYLYKNSNAKKGQDYVKQRKMNNNTLVSFMIGYSSDDNSLFRYLKSQGFKEEEMLESNLIGKSENGKLYDKFRNRLMFPIQDVRGRVIAFGGRTLIQSKEILKEQHIPKYINSPENIVYIKGNHLFGLNVVKKENRGMLKSILIVEGYMDAISLFQRGITNVVASLGTALTDSQARLLRRNAEQVILGYDSDGAGQIAIERASNILRNMGIDSRVLQLNGDIDPRLVKQNPDRYPKDPDEYIIKYGPERFKKCMDDSISTVDFKVQNLKRQLDLNNINDKIKFLNEIAKILASIDNSIEKELYLDKISQNYKITKDAIIAEINKNKYKNENNILKEIKKQEPIQQSPEEDIDKTIIRREKMIIYLLINYPNDSFTRIKNTVSIDRIKSVKNKEIISKLYEKISTNANLDNVTLWFEDQNLISYITGILSNDFEISDVDKAIVDIENAYNKEEKIKRKDEILKLLDNGEVTSKEEETNLKKELLKLLNDLKN